MSTFQKFIQYYKPYKKVFIFDLICAAFISLVDLAYPQILRSLTKTLFLKDASMILKTLPIIGGILFICYIFQAFCKYYVRCCSAYRRTGFRCILCFLITYGCQYSKKEVYYTAVKHTHYRRDCKMIEATSCGGVVIHRGKILALYKSYKNRYEGWVLPKGTVELGESHEQTALREVKEEADVKASIVKYIGKSQYNFTVPEDMVSKEVHWYLMTADNYHSKPQREEFFVDSGYYKFHEIYHLLRFSNEKQIVEKAYQEYLEMRSAGLWARGQKYF